MTEETRGLIEVAQVDREATDVAALLDKEADRLHLRTSICRHLMQLAAQHLRASLAREAELVRERDEADRRAGCAERKNARLQDDAAGRSEWLHRAKSEAGYHDSISFDRVWAETRATALAAEAKLAEARRVIEEIVPARLCGESHSPPIPDSEYLSLDKATWGWLRCARAFLSTLAKGDSDEHA